MLPPDAVRTIRRELEARLAQLNEEIRGYPQPIARCDAQLAGLIEQRSEVVRALGAVEEAHREAPRTVRPTQGQRPG